MLVLIIYNSHAIGHAYITLTTAEVLSYCQDESWPSINTANKLRISAPSRYVPRKRLWYILHLLPSVGAMPMTPGRKNHTPKAKNTKC